MATCEKENYQSGVSANPNHGDKVGLGLNITFRACRTKRAIKNVSLTELSLETYDAKDANILSLVNKGPDQQ